MRVASSVRRLAAAHWPLPAIGAVFLLTAAFVFDDYGIATDASVQRTVGHANLDYLAGDGERSFERILQPQDRFYGPFVEAPLAIAERVLGLDDSRDIHLSRHILTHLFFLAGGVVCYLLAYRLFGSRPLALVAMVLFLLHPRIYAHSFFNSKDVPFLAMFMVALYLVHRAFWRDTLAAFLLCGVGVGLLVNLRIMGLVLFAAVLALRALDLVTASGTVERRRILFTGSAFAAAAILTFHASFPVLWTDPVGRFAEMVRLFSSPHPNPGHLLFRGEWLYGSNGVTAPYIPVWAAITTPPATLLFSLAGAVALAWCALRRPRDLLRNGPLRYSLLLLTLPAVTVTAAIILENPAQPGWRHLYFLYAPLLLLAVHGLQWLASSIRGRWMRGGLCALVGVSAAVAVVSMVRIHPYEDSYFNALAGRTTPERLASRYELDYWVQSARSLVGNILDDHPSGTLFLQTLAYSAEQALSPDDRRRFETPRDFRSGEVNLYRLPRFTRQCPATAPGTYAVRIYGSTIECVVDPVAYFGSLRRAAMATDPLDRSHFDAHRLGNLMVYVRNGCSMDDTRAHFFLRIHPVDAADLPDYLRDFRHRREYGFEQRDFAFARFGARIDGNCVAAVPLPGYPITRIHTGQFTPEYAEAAWRVVADEAPLARSRFDVHLGPGGRTLTYTRGDCSTEDATARFFLHLLPAAVNDLPEHRREHGFDNFDFTLSEQGARTTDGRCVAVVPIPRYSIASIRTGQFSDRERLWETTFVWPRGE